MTRRRAVPFLAGSLLALVAAMPALAHADLVSADPPDKAVLATPPTTITLTFSEALDAKSKFNLVGAGGTVGTGSPGADPSTLVLGGLTLAPGDYEIQWTSVATDGDILRGTLTFTVAQGTAATASPTTGAPASPAPSAAPSAAASDAPSAAAAASPVAVPAAPTSGASGDVVLPIIAALVIVAVVGAVLLRRSRRAGP